MSLALGSDVGLDTEVELESVGTDPQAAPGRQHRRLLDLGQAEDADGERPALLLTTGWQGELYVWSP